MHRFDTAIITSGHPLLQAESLTSIQVNVGRLCNLSCHHCHVEASPKRTEIMIWKTMEAVLDLARQCRPCLVDITGGAPEMNPDFRAFVRQLHNEGFPVRVHTNLTVFFEPGQNDLPEFFRRHQVELVASLPCYLSDNVDTQRGSGVYVKSIEALQQLNQQGYGRENTLPLSLVYNPGSPSLPPSQKILEAAYRKELRQHYGLTFTQLLTITNMPIGRFLDDLRRAGKAEDYHQLLAESFNPDTINSLMCRDQVSVDWDGRLYDCDFNLALELPLSEGAPRTIFEADPDALLQRRICTAEHCFGCTAGSGSSCGGALVA